MTVFEGELKGSGLRCAIIISRFNSFITTRLLDGARDALTRHGVAEDAIDVVWTPGAFEIPRIAKTVVHSDKYHAVICLGAVIRGDTPHFDYVASEVSKGVALVALESPIPVIYGVLTTDTVEQAIDRAGAKTGNKGFDAALAALEMTNLLQKL